uniref:Uncharacterized protein n=1 Tax=Rhizophora mucronata TaxID=61149 RepID=A0A2P2N5Z0_RHIMU
MLCWLPMQSFLCSFPISYFLHEIQDFLFVCFE